MGVHRYTNGAWTDSGRIYRNSLNFFDLSNYYSVTPGITNIVINNDIITYNASSQYLAICYRFDLLPTDTFTIELGNESDKVQLELRFYNGETQVGTRIVIQKGTPYVISGSEEIDSFTIYLSNSTNTGKCTASNLMLNTGDTIKPFEPYNIVDWYTNTGHGYSSGAWS